MGGTIEAVSALGEGSTFTLRLPLVPVAASAVTPAAGDAVSAERAGGVRVLAAEDNDVNQLVLKTLLSQAGIEPTMVGNGRQALEAWEAADWDIILMDIQMPVMDGVVATRAIREREAASGRSRTPILAVTANAMTHQVAEYEAAGMDGMVPKPLDITALFQAMEAAPARRPRLRRTSPRTPVRPEIGQARCGETRCPAQGLSLWRASLRNGLGAALCGCPRIASGTGRKPEKNQQGDVAEWLKATVC